MMVMDSHSRREEESEKKRKRRKRDASNEYGASFKCGCGKVYLSYAALYTHTKVKHEGIFPDGTLTGVKKKQGRPKVNRG